MSSAPRSAKREWDNVLAKLDDDARPNAPTAVELRDGQIYRGLG